VRLDPHHFNVHKEQARAFVHERLAYWNQFYQYSYGKVAIRNQSSRWGSCSAHGNLNFNYRIALLPLELADYVIVHELCHLKEFNHSPRFWALVAQTMPDYHARKQALARMGIGAVTKAHLGYNATHTQIF
jgi:predicted metal-dependent hydrolase